MIMLLNIKYENSNVDATFNGLKVLSNLYTMDVYPQLDFFIIIK